MGLSPKGEAGKEMNELDGYGLSRWWFETFFYVHPYLPRNDPIFQMGWFNHQPVMQCIYLEIIIRCHILDLLPTQDSSHHQDEWIFSGEFL